MSKVFAKYWHSQSNRIFSYSFNSRGKAFPEITVFLRVSRAVADAQSAGIDFVADDRTNALVHDTSITLRRVSAVCSIALFRDTCLVSPATPFSFH